MPALSGGSDHQIEVLHTLLTALKEGTGIDELISLPGGLGAETSISSMGQRLQPAGMLTRMGKNSWILTSAAENWLESGDNGYLMAVLHSNIRYVGELMHEARTGRTQSDLLSIASDKYECSWDTLDQIRRRTAWLRSGGFMELDFRHQVVLTESGLALLERLELADSENFRRRITRKSESVSIPGAHPVVRDALETSVLTERRAAIGYIPRSEGDSLASLRKFANALKSDTSREGIDEFASAEFGLRPSSVAAALSTLKNAGLVEQIGFGTFRSTEAANACAEAEHDIDFLRIIHSKFSFVGEVLEALEEVDTPRDLAALARTRYGVPREDIAEVRTRLQMLRECGLVEEVAWGHYQVLPLGRALLAELPTASQQTAEEKTSTTIPDKETDTELSKLIDDLRATSKASSNPERFEKSVAEAFSYLGFDSQLLGGSGQTDVLVTASLSGEMKYSVIVDAKSSASGKIGETQVNYDTLKEHRSGNSAEYALVVGPSFPGTRLASRAEAHGVGLVEVNTLIAIIEQHAIAPLPLSSLREFCNKIGVVSVASLEKSWASEKRMYRLCDRVLRQLATEAANADTVTTGALSAHDLYLILRSEVEDPPTPAEIESVLSFLSSSLIHAIRKVSTQYVILEDPTTTARRLRLLASSITGQP
ncbi:PqqD family protein [Streptomyces sp. DSM 41987]|uniref:PqqD family protein n=1 Tax=Streptomyces TaxID=1883 RepID=UPI0018DF3EA8|nr:restriction endonuclease [Streptomyces fildesensis]